MVYPQQRPALGSAPIDAARTAMGGEGNLGAIKSVRLRGETRQLNQFFGSRPDADEQYVLRSIEISAVLPDRYVMAATRRSGSGRRQGFAGAVLIDQLTGRPPAKDNPAALAWQRRSFGELMLLVLLRTDTAFSLRASATADGRSIRFTGPEFDAVMDLHPESRLPLRLRYGVTMRGPGGPTGETRDNEVQLLDWKPVGGLRLPHRLRTAQNGRMVSEKIFSSIELNPMIDPKVFQR
ncbi:MAG: hypothetical protein M3R55_04270 [Acidobacteriota bacterium]|nr:hypothetical protein [Acidobacteriota bacterium]